MPAAASADIVPFHTTHMSEAAYDAERARLRETYGDTRQQAGARFEQALAVLFYRSGWTHEQLAKKEDKSRQHITRQLLFGRFLNFAPMGANSESQPNNLTERRFRTYWDQTDKGNGNERIRFLAIQKLIAEELSLRVKNRPSIAGKIAELFADGKWHHIETITKQCEAEDDEHAASSILGLKKLTKSPVIVEEKQVGTKKSYRFFRKTKSINSEELIAKLGPILEGLQAEGKKNMATMSPATVAYLAGKLKQQIDIWTK